MKKILLLILPMVMTPLLAGCQYPFEFRTEEEIRIEVLGVDPAFVEVLNEKEEVDEQIRSLNSELKGRHNDINNQILALKNELDTFSKSTKEKVRDINSRLDPHREVLKQNTKELITELKVKERSMSATEKMISRLNNLLDKSSESENLAKEVPKWQNKIASLKLQSQELQKEVSLIRDKIRQNRLKLKLLK
ncbi:hypothetical protein ACFL0T_01335 [Candidatus Omnitrophota bacterium]